ncbi:MAG: stage V sporulation protein T [Bacilli bacterium]
MKATGIVRRIDDLGRVVIPKEIRRTLRIREGDPLEIFVDREGEVILKKYSPISELGDFAKEYCEALYASLNQPVMIADRDSIIAVSGLSKRDYLGKNTTKVIEQAIADRQSSAVSSDVGVQFVDGQEELFLHYAICPIVASGDPIGAVIMVGKEGPVGEVERKTSETAAYFLAKQMEH